jgi:hypothetical protein
MPDHPYSPAGEARVPGSRRFLTTVVDVVLDPLAADSVVDGRTVVVVCRSSVGTGALVVAGVVSTAPSSHPPPAAAATTSAVRAAARSRVGRVTVIVSQSL